MPDEPSRPYLPEPGALLGTNTHRARGWTVCAICRRDIMPGTVIARPVGGTTYAHVACIAREAAAGG